MPGLNRVAVRASPEEGERVAVAIMSAEIAWRSDGVNSFMKRVLAAVGSMTNRNPDVGDATMFATCSTTAVRRFGWERMLLYRVGPD